MRAANLWFRRADLFIRADAVKSGLWRTCGTDLDRQSMHPGFQLVGQRFVDGAVLGDATETSKLRRCDANAEMRFALGPGARVPLMS